MKVLYLMLAGVLGTLPVLANEGSEDNAQSTFYLATVAGRDGGYCVVKGTDGSEQHELITSEGALDKRQLGRALRFLSYQEHVALAAGTLIGGAVSMFIPMTGFAGIGADVAYPVVIGYLDQEDDAAIILQMVSPAGLGVVAEYYQRRARVETIVDRPIYFNDRSDRKWWGGGRKSATGQGHLEEVLDQFRPSQQHKDLGLKKAEKIIARMQEAEPVFPGGCDYL